VNMRDEKREIIPREKLSASEKGERKKFQYGAII